MKKNIYTTVAVCLSFFCSQAQLTYTPITNGLNTILFEGGPTEIEVGDIDNDGDLDIVSIGDHGSPMINATETGIMVWKNNGTGTAWSQTQQGGFGYGGCALGDVNNDGKMDIGYSMHHNQSTTDFGDQIMEVALGNGAGTSWTPYDDGLATNGESWGMFGTDFADVNSDGLLDVGANAFGLSGIHVYKNNGSGTWTQTWGMTGGNSKNAFMFGDFDNDGNTDLTAASELGIIWKNNGAGQFSPMQNGFMPADTVQDYGYVCLAVGDVNNDGAKDIGVVDLFAPEVRVFTYNKSLSTWQNISNGLPVNTSGSTWNIALDDMDMDGKCDVVLFEKDSIVIYKGDGAGNWTRSGMILVAEESYVAVRTGDFDHDGYTDIVYLGSSSIGGTNFLRVYLHAVSNPSLAILPNYPQGNECFQPNSVQFIKWQSSVPVGPSAQVTIEFSSAGNSGPWTNVASSIPNSGVYQWTTPAVSSTNCYLRFTISNGSSTQMVITSAAFGIGACTTSTGINDPEEESGISIFPNPSADGIFNIESAEFNVQSLEVHNLLGEKVTSEIINAKTRALNLSEAGTGVYFIQLTSGDKIYAKKVVVQ